MKKNTILLLFITAVTVLVSCAGRASENQNKEAATKENKLKTIKLTKADFLTKVANYETNSKEWKYLGDKPAIIDFYADWCGPCKSLAPVLEELAAEYGDQIYIYKVDVDSERELAGAFRIQSIPTMLFIPMDGQPQIKNGFMPKANLKKVIDEILLKK